jgi:uncharacterized protein (TIGR04255 family)
MVTQISPLPEYDKPPVHEVVCGILFEHIDKFANAYLGVLWEKYKPEYIKCQEVAPLVPLIETFDESEPRLDMLPLPRTWFVHAENHKIIQVQRDHFLHNWRKVQEGDPYPRYETIIGDFKNYLLKFTEFLNENDLGTLMPQQYELTYINHIYQGEGWNTLSDIGHIFPNLSWQKREDSFLTSPENINWQTAFVLPERAGRLRAKIQSGMQRESGRQVIVFELTVRGIGSYQRLDTIWAWFDLSHNWVVRGFTDLTAPQVQQDIWRRTI